MDNKAKIEELEKEVGKLSKEYNKIKKEWEYLGSSLGVRDLEIRNKYKEIQILKDANGGKSE